MDFKAIITGWANLGLNKLDMLNSDLKEVSEYRLAHCHTCSMRIGNTCSRDKEGIDVKTLETKKGCGCNLSAKTLVLESKCPLSKW